MTDKVMTIKEFLSWEFEFFQKRQSGFLRLGQAFMNDHNIADDSLLFYEPNDVSARERIYEAYLIDDYADNHGDIH